MVTAIVVIAVPAVRQLQHKVAMAAATPTVVRVTGGVMLTVGGAHITRTLWQRIMSCRGFTGKITTILSMCRKSDKHVVWVMHHELLVVRQVVSRISMLQLVVCILCSIALMYVNTR